MHALATLPLNHPIKTLIFLSLPSTISLIVLVSTSTLKIHTPTLSDYYIRSHPLTKLTEARKQAHVTYSVPAQQNALDISVTRATPSADMSFEILFTSLNMLTAAYLEHIRRIEDVVLSTWQRFCRADPLAVGCDGRRSSCGMPRSILNSRYLHGVYDQNGMLCGRRDASHVITTRNITDFLQELTGDTEFDWLVGRVSQGRVGLARTRFEIGTPFEGFVDGGNAEGQHALYDEWIEGVQKRIDSLQGGVTGFVIGMRRLHQQFGQEVVNDLIFALPAITLVFVIVWIHTTSIFLALVTMVQIFFAFPPAYIIYTYILRQKYFSALQIFAIFVLLGIGADDVFVFTDAWKQTVLRMGEANMEIWLGHAYKRAVRAMFVTSITTAAAFLVMGVSKIMPVSTLGIWAGILVVVQFCMVITMYPCALVIWQRHLRNKKWFQCINPVPLPQKDDETEEMPIWYRCIPIMGLRERLWKTKLRQGNLRPLECFFHGPWVKFIHNARILLVLSIPVLLSVSIYLATKLDSPPEGEDLLPHSHPMMQALRARDGFGVLDENGRLQVSITWGIKGIDRTGTTGFDSSKLGRVQLDRSFDLKLEATQRHILNSCRMIGLNSTLVAKDLGKLTVRCWMEDFVKWRTESGRSEFENYRSDAGLLIDLFHFGMHNENGRQPHIKYITEQDIIVSQDLRNVIASEIRFVSPNKTGMPYEDMWKIYTKWQYVVDILNEFAPKQAKHAFVTGGDVWMWMVSQRTLEKSFVLGLSLVLVVTVLTLSLTTLNLATSILATICLGGVITTLLATIHLAGWNLGVAETVSVLLSVGYSFDGIAHIANAYSESSASDRLSRTRDSLTTLGISIVFGALSTACSSAMLLPATVVLFTKLAMLILLTIGLSMIWALVFLPALLLVVGPEGGFLSFRSALKNMAQHKAASFSTCTTTTTTTTTSAASSGLMDVGKAKNKGNETAKAPSSAEEIA